LSNERDHCENAISAPVMSDDTASLWLEKLHHGDADERVVALTELLEEPEGIPAQIILPLLDDGEPAVRMLTIRLLEEIGDPQAIPSLIAKVTDRDEPVARAAEAALREFRTPAAIPYLIDCVLSSSAPARTAALVALRDFKSEEAAVTFIEAVADASPRVRREAILGLAYLKRLQDFEVLRRAIRDPDPEVRRVAVEAAAGFNESIVPDLIRAIEDPEWQVRASAATSLGHFSSKNGTAALVGALCDSHWQVTKEAILGLRSSTIEVSDNIVPFLKHESTDIRIAAAAALGAVGDSSHIVALQPLLHDPDTGVQKAAQRSIQHLRIPA
jgi:HEAT repeat protein